MRSALIAILLSFVLQNADAQDVISEFPYNCSFENSFWGWENCSDNPSGWQWKIGSGNVGAIYDENNERISGPTAAYDGSSYLYMSTKTSSGTASGSEVGIVRTFDFSDLDNPILKIYTHTFYSGTSNFCPLTIWVRKVGSTQWAEIKKIFEPQSDNWNLLNACLVEFANAGQVEVKISVKINSLECCVAVDKLTIENFSVETVATDATCFSYEDGKIEVTPQGGGPLYQYSYDRGVSWTELTEETSKYVFENLAAGSYNIYIKDQLSGCTAELPTSLSQPYEIKVDITPSDIKCYGDDDGKINIFASQGGQNTGFTYSINGVDGPFVSNTDFTGLHGGIYNVVVKNSAGCLSAENSVHIGNDVYLNIDNVTFTNVEGCYGDRTGSITVIASFNNNGPLNYSNSGGSDWNNSLSDFEGLPAGSYKIAVKDKNDCIVEWPDEIVITQPEEFVFKDSSHVDVKGCYGDETGKISVEFSGGVEPYTYSIDGGIKFQESQNFDNLAADVYSLRAVDNHNCKVSGPNIIVNQPKKVVITSIDPTNVGTCYGDATGKLIINANGGTGDLNYSLTGKNSNLQTSNVFENLTAGEYYPYVEDQEGCSASWSPETLTEPDLFYIIRTETDGDVKCKDDKTAYISASAFGGTMPYTFSYNNFATSETTADGSISVAFYNLGAGTYNISAKDKMGCQAIDSVVVITEPTQLVIDDVVVTDVLCNGQATGTIKIIGSGGTAPYMSHGYSLTGYESWINKSPEIDPILEKLSAGVYDVRIIDGNGCKAQKNKVEISQPTVLKITREPVVYPVTTCYGDPFGKIQLYADGGTNPLEYSIDNGKTFQIDNPIFDNLKSGTYYPYIKDANGCALDEMNMVTINEPAPLEYINIYTEEVAGCKGDSKGSIEIFARGGEENTYDCSIDGGVTFKTNNLFENLPAGEYNVVIRDANHESCKLEYPFNPVLVSEPDELKVDKVEHTNNECYGESKAFAQIYVSGGSTKKHSYYYYENADTSSFASGQNFKSNLAAGYYKYAIRDGYDCVVYTDFTITEPDEIFFQIVDTAHITSCYGDNIGKIHVKASGGAGDFTLTAFAQGVYPENVVKGNEAVWDNLKAGLYEVSAVDKTGCSPEEMYITIRQVDRLNQIINTDSAFIKCYNDETAEIVMSASGGVQPYYYSIDGVNFSEQNDYKNLSAGQYVLQVKDAHDCLTAAQTLEITNPNEVKLEYEPYDISCYSQNNGRIIAKATGGNKAFSFYIDGKVNPEGKNSGVFKNLTDGKYVVSVKDGYGCEAISDSIEISRPINSADFNLSVEEGCTPLDIQLTQLNNGMVYYEIDGHRTDYYTGKSTVNQTLTNNTREAKKVKIIAILRPDGSIDNCRDSVTKYVYVYPKPLVDFDINPNDTLIYPDTIAQIHLFNNVTPKITTAHWDFGDGQTSDNLDCTNDKNIYADMHYYSTCGNYNVIVSASDGRCWDTVQKPLWINPRTIFADINPDITQGCAPLKVKFVGSAINADSTVWNFGDSTIAINSPEPSHVFETEGDYVVSYTAFGDCGANTTVTKVIHVFVKPVAGFTQDKDTVYVGQHLRLASDEIGAYYYQWDLGDGTTSDRNELTHQYKAAGTYDISLVVSTTNSCSDTAEVKHAVKVISEPQVIFPTAFTPNGDGHNDVFKCIYLGEVLDFKIVILNSKGQIVFRSNDINEAWDGKRGGANCAPGIYLYKYKIVLKDNSFYIKNGSLVLLR